MTRKSKDIRGMSATNVVSTNDQRKTPDQEDGCALNTPRSGVKPQQPMKDNDARRRKCNGSGSLDQPASLKSGWSA